MRSSSEAAAEAVSRPLLITPGEPAGIGPELTAQWLRASAMPSPGFVPLVVADPALMARAARTADAPAVHEVSDVADVRPGRINVLPVPLTGAVRPGAPDPVNGPYVLACLDRAVDLCMAGDAAALVTGPVQKHTVAVQAPTFRGHTEYLAQRTGTAAVVMLLVVDSLRVALATTHLPLAQVSGAIQPESLTRTLDILHDDLQRRFAIPQPRILVAGLNPHAGDGGLLGSEDDAIVAPVCAAQRARGRDVVGPLPADTLFLPRHLAGADAVLAMYHDQGLPVIKHLGFDRAVNVTLGLPLIRTSVDHGTALDLVGTGRADHGSLAAAAQLAAALATQAAEARAAAASA